MTGPLPLRLRIERRASDICLILEETGKVVCQGSRDVLARWIEGYDGRGGRRPISPALLAAINAVERGEAVEP